MSVKVEGCAVHDRPHLEGLPPASDVAVTTNPGMMERGVAAEAERGAVDDRLDLAGLSPFDATATNPGMMERGVAAEVERGAVDDRLDLAGLSSFGAAATNPGMTERGVDVAE